LHILAKKKKKKERKKKKKKTNKPTSTSSDGSRLLLSMTLTAYSLPEERCTHRLQTEKAPTPISCKHKAKHFDKELFLTDK